MRTLCVQGSRMVSMLCGLLAQMACIAKGALAPLCRRPRHLLTHASQPPSAHAGRVDSPLLVLHSWLVHWAARRQLEASLRSQIAALMSDHSHAGRAAAAGGTAPMDVDGQAADRPGQRAGPALLPAVGPPRLAQRSCQAMWRACVGKSCASDPPVDATERMTRAAQDSRLTGRATAGKSLALRLEPVQAHGVGRSAWRLWLGPQRPPLVLLLYGTKLKVELGGLPQVRQAAGLVLQGALCSRQTHPAVTQHKACHWQCPAGST